MQWLKQRIIDLVQWFADLFVAVFSALWDILRDILAWLLEQVLSLVVAAVRQLDLSGLDAHNASWASLPAEIINVLGLLGAGTATAIIVSAAGIRLLLQLVPFTRLGS